MKFIDAFCLEDRQCLVFELLDKHLYEVLQQRKLKGLPLASIQKIARSSLHALAFLSRPEIDVIHADIKPENLLMCVGSSDGDVKLIDFGSSCKAHENVGFFFRQKNKRNFLKKQMQTYIQSRFYRAPGTLGRLGLAFSNALRQRC